MAPVSCKNSIGVVRTQIWHKADQADATGQTDVPQRSDRWSDQGAAAIPFGLLAQQEAHVGLGYCSHV
jgi:hypothetical protein